MYLTFNLSKMTAVTCVLFLCSVLPMLSLAKLQCTILGGKLTVKVISLHIISLLLLTNPQNINLRRTLDSMLTPIFPALIMA